MGAGRLVVTQKRGTDRELASGAILMRSFAQLVSLITGVGNTFVENQGLSLEPPATEVVSLNPHGLVKETLVNSCRLPPCSRHRRGLYTR